MSLLGNGLAGMLSRRPRDSDIDMVALWSNTAPCHKIAVWSSSQIWTVSCDQDWVAVTVGVASYDDEGWPTDQGGPSAVIHTFS